MNAGEDLAHGAVQLIAAEPGEQRRRQGGDDEIRRRTRRVLPVTASDLATLDIDRGHQ